MRYDFTNKVIWLTGASSGIGLALAIQLIHANAKLVVTSRGEDRLNKLFSKYSNVMVAAGDITSSEVNKHIVEKIIERFATLDCAIFNAGNAKYVDINNFSVAPFEQMMQVNYLSMVRGIEASLPYLRKSSSPYLVGMSSSAAWHGMPQGQAYSASKAAIRNLFQGLNIQLSAENIPVSWICPGFVETPLTDKNNFPMPAKISADEAAEIIYKKLCRQKTEIHFPKRFTWLAATLILIILIWMANHIT